MGGDRKRRRGRLRPGKIITQVIVFLLVGAIVNVAVAWGCMVAWPMRMDYEGEDLIVVGRNPASDLLHASWTVPRKLQPARLYVSAESRTGWVEFSAVYEPDMSPEAEYFDMAWFSVLEAGWPCRSLRGDFRSPVEGDSHYRYALMIPQAFRPAHGRIVLWDYLPLFPLWPGFAINTLFYAIILWLLVPGPFVLRRLIRIKRGRCPKCGYDLRGQLPGATGCPECGWNREAAS